MENIWSKLVYIMPASHWSGWWAVNGEP